MSCSHSNIPYRSSNPPSKLSTPLQMRLSSNSTSLSIIFESFETFLPRPGLPHQLETILSEITSIGSGGIVESYFATTRGWMLSMASWRTANGRAAPVARDVHIYQKRYAFAQAFGYIALTSTSQHRQLFVAALFQFHACAPSTGNIVLKILPLLHFSSPPPF
jgi:hypothetical protein